MKKFLLALFIAPLALLVILEAGFRIYGGIDPFFDMMPDATYLRYRGAPRTHDYNGFRLNSRGFKDTEFVAERRPETVRILGVGDSITYGAVPYENCYMTLLERRLNAMGAPCEVYNVGVPSAAPIDYLSLLINEGLKLNPDLVLVNLFLGDDLHASGTRNSLLSRSAAATFIRNLFVSAFPPQGRSFPPAVYRDNLLVRDRASYLDYLAKVQADAFDPRSRKGQEDFYRAWDCIRRMKEICDRRGVSFAAVICPSDIQIYDDVRRDLMVRVGAAEERYDFRLPNRRFAETFARHRVPYFDLTDVFAQHRRQTGIPLTHGNDPHWNLEGNRLAAEAVASWLAPRVRDIARDLKTVDIRMQRGSQPAGGR